MGSSSLIDWCGRRRDDAKVILYFSGILGKKYAEQELQTLTKGRMNARCISYAYWKTELRVKIALKFLIRECGVRVMMDSGAFTLQKDPRCNWDVHDEYLDGYEAALRKFEGELDWYAPVDWRRSVEMVDGSMKRMHERGLKPVPVFHGNDPFRHLERYVKDGYPLICIAQPQRPGSKRMMAGERLYRFYSDCFELAEKHGTALHGFSQTGRNLFRFPWYSVDSTSWTSGSKQGELLKINPKLGIFRGIHIATGMRKNDGLVTYEDLLKGNGKPRKVNARKVWAKMNPEAQQVFIDIIESRGFTLKQMQEDYMVRVAYSAMEFQDAIDKHTWQPVTRFGKLL